MSRKGVTLTKTILVCDVCATEDVVGLYTCLRCQREACTRCLLLVQVFAGTNASRRPFLHSDAQYHGCRDCIVEMFHEIDAIVRDALHWSSKEVT